MKAILEFNLDEHEDEEAHLRCIKSTDLVIAINEIDNYLRGELKYNDNLHPAARKALDNARERLYQILNERNINIDELIS